MSSRKVSSSLSFLVFSTVESVGDCLGFGQMTKQLMALAGGRVVLVLEGGYDPQSTSMSAELCLRALLNDEVRGEGGGGVRSNILY